ncbi:MAG: response regulator transcription factor [Parvibaculum sp.]|nr:response regulator transcription factor [Parvibaculum sp.]
MWSGRWRIGSGFHAGAASVTGSGFSYSAYGDLSTEEDYDFTTSVEDQSRSAPKALVALVNPKGASLDLITRATSTQEMDFLEFQNLDEFVRFLRQGNSCDLVLLDCDSIRAGATGLKEDVPTAISHAGVVATASSQEVNSMKTSMPMALPDTGSEAAEDSAGRPEPRIAQLGSLVLDFRTSSATWKGHRLDLTVTQFNIVHLLARRAGENLTYRQVYDVVHKPGFHAGDGEDGYQTNVRSLIKRVRQQFKAVDESFAEIENHRGVGYRWRHSGALEEPVASEDLGDISFGANATDRAASRWTKLANAMSRLRPAQATAPIVADQAAPSLDSSDSC